MILSPRHIKSFCSDSPTIKAFILGTDGKAKYPLMIEISAGDRWILDPNEVFAHADEFKFESGTFDNSTDVFLVATRGAIQFVVQDKRLMLHRVSYTNSQSKEK